MKTYYYRPTRDTKATPKLRRLKDPITLCETCHWHERGNIVVTTQHEPKPECDRCDAQSES